MSGPRLEPDDTTRHEPPGSRDGSHIATDDLAAQAGHAFPDLYEPQAEAPEIAPKDVMNWMGSAPREQVQAFVQNRLGPQVASQLAQASPTEYKGALFSLFASPQYRRALVGEQQ